ncbi:MAG TPA: alpha-1,4-glucan--maltose-1-phosphate maltosyltransferase [Gaiellaceae bacterium]|nr:alpha-1,4-glucan--maltose-1-phosphate maltosyltransferase [Gaiellaceae bacterium]
MRISRTLPLPKTPQPRIQIQAVEPLLDCGRFPVKRTVGDSVEVYATLFKDGHDTLAGAVRVKGPGDRRFSEEPLHALGNDRWGGSFVVDRPGRWQFQVAAWTDRIATWQDELRRKVEGGQTLKGELSEGALLLGRDAVTVEEGLAATAGDRHGEACSATVEVAVDRELARFGAWYELFPRSWGGFTGVAEVLPKLAELGFDVVYLPPIHPIGVTNRKGRNNAVTAEAGDVGSPWAIGSEEGGHDAIDPSLGTWADFDAMVAAAKAAGIELALDFAIQCSPDHPWLKEHPEWFNRRPDGTLKYAENPPKRYQDIYNVNFESEDWQGLWQALRDVVIGWVERGITVFRVDNPHTKPVPFWEWLIREVHAEHPEVIFLAEAFTRPSMMTTLAKVGFAQSYTYFTWKNTKVELVEYMTELIAWQQFYRANAFVNTPDILHEYLQLGGRPAFEARLVLAATLVPSYGIYSGFESLENVPVRAGSEEYLDSEKYEVKRRALDGVLLPLVQRLNEIRRGEPALQRVENLRWLETENDQLVAYAKDDLVCVVNVDPFATQEGVCVIPVALGYPPAFDALELLSGDTFTWRAGRNYVRLLPGQAHIIKVGP